MAVAVHHEDNQAKWVGARPAHGGEQVSVSIFVNTGGWVDLYTVGIGKVLLVNTIAWSLRKADTTAYIFSIQLTTETDAVRFGVVNSVATAIEPQPGFVAFPIPYELIAGYKVRGYAENADIILSGGIHGFLIDA